jgi:hypothetical protein
MRPSTLLAALSLAAAGCGGASEMRTAKVTGKVLCNGEPVPNVRVYFAPVGTKGKLDAGRQGIGNAQADGTFMVSTYGDGDGAVVGMHNVAVSTPHPEDFPDFNCDCITNGSKIIKQIEVKADGENDVVIDLPPKKDKSTPSISDEDLQDISNATAQ